METSMCDLFIYFFFLAEKKAWHFILYLCKEDIRIAFQTRFSGEKNKKVIFMLSLLGKKFSRHFEIFYLIFARKKTQTFHANCLLGRQLAWSVKVLFSAKKKSISFLLPEVAHRLVKASAFNLADQNKHFCKYSRARWDGTGWTVSSGPTLFAFFFFQFYNDTFCLQPGLLWLSQISIYLVMRRL